MPLRRSCCLLVGLIALNIIVPSLRAQETKTRRPSVVGVVDEGSVERAHPFPKDKDAVDRKKVADWRGSVRKAIKVVSDREGIDLVLPVHSLSGDVLLYFNESVDITGLVIAEVKAAAARAEK